MSKIKNIAFPVDAKLHKKMRMYLLSLKNEKTIKDYLTEILEKDLKNKTNIKFEEGE